MKQFHWFLLTLALLLLGTQATYGQVYQLEFGEGGIRGKCSYELVSSEKVKLIDIWNEGSTYFDVKVDGVNINKRVMKGDSCKIGKEGTIISIESPSGNLRLFNGRKISALWKEKHPEEADHKIEEEQKPQPVTETEQQPDQKETATASTHQTHPARETAQKPAKTSTSTATQTSGHVSNRKVLLDFEEYMKEDAYYSEDAVEEAVAQAKEHIKALEEGTDPNALHEAKKFLKERSHTVEVKKGEIANTVLIFLNKHYTSKGTKYNAECITSLTEKLNKSLAHREHALNQLEEAINKAEGAGTKEEKESKGVDSQTLILGGGALLVIILLVVFLPRILKKRKGTAGKSETATASAAVVNNDDDTDIVIRRKTTTMLKKQSLDDVRNNNAYLPIDCADFCSDSAVKRIYVKNTCIKEIYDMYANDLRNPENPKEDGCMVLGRWVENSLTGDYCVSLEQVVLPGDDAVFKEYELNFGGKIKMRMADVLRKLRRETDLQYDLTCWVHSHPGLGVFFSNFDSGVHMQLKHHSHPKFLTAIVVDILTPRMEMGIFTFKKTDELVVNSKNDITRMYSLEEMYQWAMESIRSSHKADEYFDVLSQAKLRTTACDKIQLSNGAIIDICRQVDEMLGGGSAKWAYGFARETGKGVEYYVDKISEVSPAAESRMGCFLIGSHLSIPSIRKALGDQQEQVKFVIFYSTTDASLVSMPVVDGSLPMDENYYSRQQLEDLKIWTRRKR